MIINYSDKWRSLHAYLNLLFVWKKGKLHFLPIRQAQQFWR